MSDRIPVIGLHGPRASIALRRPARLSAGGVCVTVADRNMNRSESIGRSPAQASHARVWIREPGAPPRSAAVTGERTLIGRGDHCDLQLGDPTVSWDHLELTRHGSALIATDLGSRNGSFLNGRQLEAPARVSQGDALLLGSVQIEIAALTEPRGATQVPAGSPIASLTEQERKLAAALVRGYRDPATVAPRPASRAELAAALFVSERTVQRRLDQLARTLGIPDAGRDRGISVAQRVLELGLDRQR